MSAKFKTAFDLNNFVNSDRTQELYKMLSPLIPELQAFMETRVSDQSMVHNDAMDLPKAMRDTLKQNVANLSDHLMLLCAIVDNGLPSSYKYRKDDPHMFDEVIVLLSTLATMVAWVKAQTDVEAVYTALVTHNDPVTNNALNVPSIKKYAFLQMIAEFAEKGKHSMAQLGDIMLDDYHLAMRTLIMKKVDEIDKR